MTGRASINRSTAACLLGHPPTYLVVFVREEEHGPLQLLHSPLLALAALLTPTYPTTHRPLPVICRSPEEEARAWRQGWHMEASLARRTLEAMRLSSSFLRFLAS